MNFYLTVVCLCQQQLKPKNREFQVLPLLTFDLHNLLDGKARGRTPLAPLRSLNNSEVSYANGSSNVEMVSDQTVRNSTHVSVHRKLVI